MVLDETNTTIAINGGLILSFHRSGRQCRVRIAPWKDGFDLEIMKGADEDRDFVEKNVRLIDALYQQKPEHPIHAFACSIPKHILAIVQKTRCIQYRIVWLMKHSWQAIGLYELNRPLFYQLVQSHFEKKQIVEMLKKPQHELLRRLYPENKSSLSYKSVGRILRKIIVIQDEEAAIHGVKRFLVNGDVTIFAW